MNILITGGAGFIGSNIVETLIQQDNVSLVRVLDNLETGYLQNIKRFQEHPKFEWLEGDIRDFNTCLKACDNINLVCHQAALGSVPRSIKDPLTTNDVNITGTLNIFYAAKEKNVKRVVYAASSSTYGDSKKLPKVEPKIGNPLSPYAVTKLVNELYANVFSSLYNIEFIGLRYFNVFGPNQSPNGAYAAVVPLFMQALLEGKSPTINGDGLQSRDFTYVANAVQANVKALFTTNKKAVNQVYNVAVGDQTTLVDMFNMLKNIAKSDTDAHFGPARAGDIKHSLADISKAKKLLDYNPIINIQQGLEMAFDWYKSNFEKQNKDFNA
jgi:UDP-N-acetylglucosamine/UDP-N-acetylgalactosamine 4-epimerase